MQERVNSASHGESAPLTLQEVARHESLTAPEACDGFESRENSFGSSDACSPSVGVGVISPSVSLSPEVKKTMEPTYAEAAASDKDSLPYWISVQFVFGSLLYTSGSLAWTFDHYLTPNDYYSLVTVAFFTGGTSFGVANFMNLYSQTKRASCLKALKSPNFYIALIFLTATMCYYFISLSNLLGFVHARGSPMWIAQRCLYFMGGTCFWVGGSLSLWFCRNNEAKSRISWLSSWCNALGGFCFFVAAFGLLSDNLTVVFWLAELPYIVGSALYLLGSVAGLRDWSKGQRERGSVWDVLMLCLYTVTLAVAVTGAVYACLCARYMDWIKNFALNMFFSVAVLSLESYVHRIEDVAKRPLKLIISFSRVFMIFLTANLSYDAYQLAMVVSRNECGI